MCAQIVVHCVALEHRYSEFRSGNTNTYLLPGGEEEEEEEKKTPDRYFGFEALRMRVCTPPSSTQMTVLQH